MPTKRLPQIQTHVNRLLAARVLIRNNRLPRHPVVRHGNDLCAEAVVLRLAKPVKDARGDRDEGHAGGDLVGEEGAEAAGAKVVEDLAAVGGGAEHEDGAGGAGAGDGGGGLLLGSRLGFADGGGGGCESQGEGCDGDGELHCCGIAGEDCLGVSLVASVNGLDATYTRDAALSYIHHGLPPFPHSPAGHDGFMLGQSNMH